MHWNQWVKKHSHARKHLDNPHLTCKHKTAQAVTINILPWPIALQQENKMKDKLKKGIKELKIKHEERTTERVHWKKMTK